MPSIKTALMDILHTPVRVTLGMWAMLLLLTALAAVVYSPLIPAGIGTALFWVSAFTALAVSLYAWRMSGSMGETHMLSAYFVIASCITMMITSLTDLCNISLLGKGYDTETGILLGAFLGYCTVTWIAFRISDRFPVALSWWMFTAFLMAMVLHYFPFADINATGQLILNGIAVLAILTTVLLLSRFKRHLNNNLFLAVLTLCGIFVIFITPSSKENLTVSTIGQLLCMLLGLWFLAERHHASAMQKCTASVFVLSGFADASLIILQELIGINEVVSGIPAFICSQLMMLMARLHRKDIPRGAYWAIQLTFLFMGIYALIPESACNDLSVPLIGTMLLLLFAMVWYSHEPAAPIRGQGWHHLRLAVQVAGCTSVITAWFVFSLISLAMLSTQAGPSRFIATLHGTPLWPGDMEFLWYVMKERSLWPESVGGGSVGNMRVSSYLKSIRPSQDRFTWVTTSTSYENQDRGFYPEDIGVYWDDTSQKYLTLIRVSRRSPAGAAGLARGDRISAINGMSIAGMDQKKWTKILENWKAGSIVSMNVETGSGKRRDVSLKIGESYDDTPMSRVVVSPKGNRVGYLYLESFNPGPFKGIEREFRRLRKEGVRDLVLDLRYNSGGHLYNAALLAGLIAGSTHDGDLFVTSEHHPVHSKRNSEYLIRRYPDSLHTRRIAVLTSGETCSASEAVINGLKPHMPVHTVGSTTCGKPYGMLPLEYGDKTVLPVDSRILNSRGEGHYIYGIRPDIRAKDDLNHQLGDPEEGMLKAALMVLDGSR